MATPQEIRNIRLSNDFQAMNNIKGHIIDWQPIKGTAPYVEAYRLTVNVRSIKGEGPQYRDQHEITVELPEGYPNAKPMTKMISKPVVYHPNWWADGRWCEGYWDIAEGLGDYVIRMIRTLQYDPEITNENSPANSEAKGWYLANRNRGIFPCDNQVLPDPSKKKTFIIQEQKKTFTIHSNS
jgi:ubiquitin-protein ligase